MRLQDVGTENVTLLDDFLLNAEQKDIEFLLGTNPTGHAPQQILDPYRFLAHFYTTAGLERPAQAIPYEDSWERSTDNNFRAHMFGHYMSALALAYQATHDEGLKKQIKAKLMICVTELTKCQTTFAEKYPERAGYIAPFGDVRLDEIDGLTGGVGISEGTVFVPWYNLHKILAGLLDIYKHVDVVEISEPALALARGFGNYFYNVRVSKYDQSKKDKMLRTEYGGMNDAFYELYNLTGNLNYRKCAEMFDEVSLFDELANGNNILPGRHANTQIPKFIGALKRYTTITQNEDYQNALTEQERAELPKYLNAAQNFFDIVLANHSYITGGNSCDEHFHQPNTLASMINRDATHETCNTHNMLKLARELFKITGNKKYSDYYENAFINGILSSQHPETGEMMYFHPMGAGYYKLFRHGLFWCCTGTGIESFVKLGDSIYFKNDERIYVNMFFASEYHDPSKNLKLIQTANIFKDGNIKLQVSVLNGEEVATGTSLYVRCPDWNGNHVITVAGKEKNLAPVDGYFIFDDLKNGDVIELSFTFEVAVDELADNPNVMAFRYGPLVLSVNLGAKGLDATNPNGILVLVPQRDTDAPELVNISNGKTVAEWKADFANHFVAVDTDEIKFKLNGTELDDVLYYTPHYQKYQERYGLYMTFTDPVTEAFEKQKREAERLALLTKMGASAYLDNFDNHAYEAGYNMQENNTSTALWMGKSCRHGHGSDAWLSYDFPVVLGVRNFLNSTIVKYDKGRTWEIRINDQLIGHQVISDVGVPEDEVFYNASIEIPAELLNDKTMIINDVSTPCVTVKFVGNGEWLGGIFGLSINQAD